MKNSMFLSMVCSIALILVGSARAEELKVSGYVQLRFVAGQSDSPEGNTFTFGNTYFTLDGKLKDGGSYRLQVNLAYSKPEKLARDVYVRLTDLSPNWQVDIGQFRVPFGYEIVESPYRLLTIERSMVIEKLFNIRDIGVVARRESGSAKYWLAIINGAGYSLKDDNKSKDVVGGVGISSGKYEFGISQYLGRSEGRAKNRTGVDLHYEDKAYIFKGEFIVGRDHGIDRSGWYILGAYIREPKVYPVMKYEVYDPDTGVAGDRLTCLTLGLIYWLADDRDLKINYEINGEEGTSIANNVLRVQLQFEY